jgi:hypothetical protein
MIPTDAQLRRIADDLAGELLKGGFLELHGDRAVLRERLFTVLQNDFAQEAALEREADAFADAHRREMIGMDRIKLVDLVKQRLAKERGFVL